MNRKLGGKKFFKAFEDFSKENGKTYWKNGNVYTIDLGWEELHLVQEKTKYYFSLSQPIDGTSSSCKYYDNITSL